MRVGIDVSQAIYGTGVSDYTINLVRALSCLPDLKLELFASSFRRRDEFRSLFANARIFPFPPTVLHWLWNVLHTVRIETFLGRLDVFHASDWTQPPTQAPSVTTVHDLSPLLFADRMGRTISQVHALRLNRAVKDCRKIICVSQSTAEDLSRLFSFPSSRIEIIPEALPSRFDMDPSLDQVKSVKSRWGLSDYLITVGTPQPRKNYSGLISAFTAYKSQYRLPSKLVIVGGRGWGTPLPRHPAVVQTGYLDDLQLTALVKGAKSLVIPSLYEGFGLPILLGWRQQVPVAVSNLSSLPEVGGKAVTTFDPRDPEDIAAGVASAIVKAPTLISQGKRRLLEYSWPKIAASTHRLYKSLC